MSCLPARPVNGRWPRLLLAIVCICLSVSTFDRTWAQADANANLQAHLAAGEFGPAIQLAGALNDAGQRDQALGAIAAAQIAAGATRGSLHTAYDISSDVARQSVLDQFGPRPGARGGGVTADFDSLIDLITSTIAPQSWDDVGGPGSVDGFDGGVRVDASGLLKRMTATSDASLASIRKAAIVASGGRNPHVKSALRKISLTRLEREVQLLRAAGRDPTEAMQTLAGLHRVKYVFVYPHSGDIVLAGPAGDWRRDAEGRYIDAEAGRPVVTLDDFVVTLRNAYSEDGKFGCSINPRKAGLAAAQLVNDRWATKPLKPSQREKWLEEFRSAVGKQDIVVYGIDPRTRAARVLVEADYRMKLVGMGLEPGTLGVTSYLDSIEVAPGGTPPPLDVLRWWFTLNYKSLQATEPRDGFELRGPGAKVLSENELVTELGERVHTGKSNELNRKFAESFTKHFEVLAAKYPVYADLRNIFDLALVSALMHSQDLPGQVGWHMTHFGPQGAYEVGLGPAPTEVESVINHRVIGGKHVVAGVSGGVTVAPRALVEKEAIQTDEYGLVKVERSGSAPKGLPRGAWWWD